MRYLINLEPDLDIFGGRSQRKLWRLFCFLENCITLVLPNLFKSMPVQIRTVVEKQRGCGFKKPGGLYLIGSNISSPCCLLPFPLTACRCCGNQIKFSRGFNWITTSLFLRGSGLPSEDDIAHDCDNCFLSKTDQPIGLMWVGESFYKTPKHFIAESQYIGISKRISQLPKKCEPGKTWIALAHKKAIVSYPDDMIIGAIPYMKEKDLIYKPGIFMIFKLTAVQYVVNGKESNDELEKLQDKGIELIKVIPEGQQQTINI